MKFDVEKNLKIAGFFLFIHFKKILSLARIGEKSQRYNLTPKT